MAEPARHSFRRTEQVIHESIARGQNPGVQLYVSRRGEPLLDAGYGDGWPGVPMTADSITMWLSAVKPVTTIAIGQLVDRGQVEIDQPVVSWIPEFGQRGKESVTVRHLLEHTAGFRFVAARWSFDPWDEIIQTICQAKLEKDWVPGQRAGYHVASSWYVLGEIVRRVDGRPIDRYVREEIFEPLGMDDSWLAMPEDRYDVYGDRIAPTFQSELGEESANPVWSTSAGAAICRPGGSGRGPIRELGTFYEHLLAIIAGKSGVVTLDTLRTLTTRSRINMFDRTFNHTVDWAPGFMVDSKHHGEETVPYGFGRYCGRSTFGHAGAQSSTGFADPENELVVAVVFNGMPGEAAHQPRLRAICNAIYEDLEIA